MPDIDTSFVALFRPLVTRLGLGELRGKLRVPRVPDDATIYARFARYGVNQLRMSSKGQDRSTGLNAMPHCGTGIYL
jgi:hypothetical protein